MRLLEKDPADRPQSADEVVRELEAMPAPVSSGMLAPRRRAQRRVLAWLAGGTFVLAVVGASVYWRWAHAPQRNDASALVVASARSVSKSVAVLPFVSLSAEQETEYFSDGMTEELIDALAKVPELQVAARTSSFAFKGKSLSVRTIGDSLKVGALVEGNLAQSFLPEVHKRCIHRHAIDPRGEGRITTKCGEFTEDLNESILGQVLGLGDVARHT